MDNPFLSPFQLSYGALPFDQFTDDQVRPAIDRALVMARERVDAIKTQSGPPDFANTIDTLEYADEELDTVSTVFFNLHSAQATPRRQELAKEISPLLTAFHNDVLLDEELFRRVKAVTDRPDLGLNAEQRTVLDDTYKAFVRNGALLDTAGKERLRQIDNELSTLSLEFGDHLLDEVKNYRLVIREEARLAGLPDYARRAAREAAAERGLSDAWVFTLNYPSYLAFMQYADDRDLREELARAFGAKGFKGDGNDNRKLIRRIIDLRYERARLLGYEHHAHFVLEDRMAGDTDTVVSFISRLETAARDAARRDLEELQRFADENGGPGPLRRWDFAYYSEKLRHQKFHYNDETVKPYFPLQRVIDGVFDVAGQLYGLRFTRQSDLPVYHADVQVFSVADDNGPVGLLYADFFPREGKPSGAYMTSYRDHAVKGGERRQPIAAVVCNFSKPDGDTPSLLTLEEVLTFFHEFGHALHVLLSRCRYASVAGASTKWDFVELPSQLMENWVYERACLERFARHHRTGEPIPDDLLENIKASMRFQKGYATMRQLSFAVLDMGWHTTPPEEIDDVHRFERSRLDRYDLFPYLEGTNMSCSFAHIFNGGYAAGYYSYKWAEVLDADAFSLFQERGIFDPETAAAFREHILSRGGSEDPMLLYRRFRGRGPDPEALLRRDGL